MNARSVFRLILTGLLALATWAASLAVPLSVAASSSSWRGEYYNNMTLSGSPAFVRHDGDLAFDWGGGSPGSGISHDHFSVRWTRTVHFDHGTYKFSTKSDDGVRLYVDGKLIVDEWSEMDRAEHSGRVELGHGDHAIRLEYYEHQGSASVRLSWEESDSLPSTVGNIITCVRPANSWIKVYRLDGGAWADVHPSGFGPLNVRGDLKLDGMAVDRDKYGHAGHPYRVELWADGRLIRSVGDTGRGEAEFRVRAGADNPTPWGCPAP